MLRKLYRFLANRTYGVLWGPLRYKYLFKEIKNLKPEQIMEIGTWRGSRAYQMIELAKKFRPAEKISYYGFDLFEEMTEGQFVAEYSKRPLPKDEVEKKLKETGANISLYKGNTIHVLPNVIGALPKIDFIFIDGGHSIETISNDWQNVQKVMGPKTVVIFDDYWPDILDAGAKPIVDNIDKIIYNVAVLPRIDKFKKDSGILRIQFARVTKK